MTESKELKDGQYNDTQKKDHLAPKSKICGVAAIPGLEFRSKIVFAVCPHCSSTGATEVQSFWSIKNYLYCYYYGGYWGCWQLINGKDWTLKDAVHNCGSCKKLINHYNAC